MRLCIQRVKQAKVTVSDQVTGEIGKGLLVFMGVHKEDTPDKTLWLAKKVVSLRIFPDAADKMNLDIQQINGDILVVSQFTLYGNCSAGRRPDFIEAALPEIAFMMYEKFLSELRELLQKPIPSGIFGAYMQVDLINDGPVTFLLEK
jgi:D-aminoacyl-tRNA deacylase